MDGAGPLPGKIIFVSKVKSLGAFWRGFYGSVTKRRLQKSAKNYPKIYAQTKGEDGRIIPPEYATVNAT